MPTPFDPDHALGEGVYGLTHTPEEAAVVLIPVPFEATCSFGTGTAGAPRAILQASPHIDLLDRLAGRPYERGIAMLPVEPELERLNQEARALAVPVIEAGGPGEDRQLRRRVARVNHLCAEMNEWVGRTAGFWRERGKLVGIVGGDHSVPFGAIGEAAREHPGMGILHVDAHSDLRDAFEGFTWSHASIMWNVIERLPGVKRLVQVGIRDYCDQELALAEESGRVGIHFDADLQERLLDGEAWGKIASEIVEELPREVYLSVDVDGLDPALCPHTGTPIPGGLTYPQVVRLMKDVVDTGRRIVGFDLVEVAPDPTGATRVDVVTAAKLLYVMAGFGVMSRG